MNKSMDDVKELRRLAKEHLSPVITRVTEHVIERAHGANFWTAEGYEFIDFVSGVAVNALGHTHQDIVEAIQKQAGELIHFGLNYGYYESVIRLAKKLADIAPGDLDTVFFSNSGAEAIDGALKLARASTKRPIIIAFEGSFHGRTIGATTVTASSAKYRKDYEPLMGGVYHVPYPYQRSLGFDNEEDCVDYCLKRLNQLFALRVDPSQVAAILIEPVMGEGGYVSAPFRFLQELRRIADEHGILLIFDEVQTGFGRTGKMFASEHSGVVPDVMVLAKALSSGMPLGAIIANRQLHDKWPTGTHGSTFGGNPISCAAALASINVIQREHLVARSQQLGEHIVTRLTQKLNSVPYIAEIRGIGLMIGIEFKDQQGNPNSGIVAEIRRIALENRLLIMSCGVYGQTIRLMLPLNIDEKVLNDGLDILESAIMKASEIN